MPVAHHYLIADVVVYFLSVAAGQVVSYGLLISDEIASRAVRRLAVAGILLLVLAFSLLSYHPPQSFLFQYPESVEYGILESYRDHDYDHEDDTTELHGS